MALHRRRFLGALVLAPSALVACSTGSAAGKPAVRAPAKAPGARGDAAAAPAAEARLSAVRAFALPGGAEPAFTFRASTARPGER